MSQDDELPFFDAFKKVAIVLIDTPSSLHQNERGKKINAHIIKFQNTFSIIAPPHRKRGEDPVVLEHIAATTKDEQKLFHIIKAEASPHQSLEPVAEIAIRMSLILDYTPVELSYLGLTVMVQPTDKPESVQKKWQQEKEYAIQTGKMGRDDIARTFYAPPNCQPS